MRDIKFRLEWANYNDKLLKKSEAFVYRNKNYIAITVQVLESTWLHSGAQRVAHMNHIIA